MPTRITLKADRRPNAPQWIDSILLHELDRRLWHATTEDRWIRIVSDGVIRPDADANFDNSFCRSIYGVSLFDLSLPDDAVPQSATHWSNWLGQTDDKPRIWIEIDRAATASSVLRPQELLERWKAGLSNGVSGFRIIAGIEAAHIGAIRLDRIKRVLRIERTRWRQIATN